jgi:hypothetical protein
VKKPGLAQQEWACQGEYRVWSKRYASFNLPLSVENRNELAEACHPRRQQSKNAASIKKASV